jgi:hypothetical protein
MRPRVLQISPYSLALVEAITQGQAVNSGGVQELNIDGSFVVDGVAIMDEPRQVVLALSSDETARVFVITGTDSKGNLLIEAVRGVDSANATTVNRFATVTSIKVDDDLAGVVEVGTGNIVSTGWLPLDYLRENFKVALGLTINANHAADMTVDLTVSNILDRRGNDPTAGTSQHVRSEFELFFPEINIFDHDTMFDLVASATGNIAFPVRAVRLTSNARLTGDAGDPVDLEVVQAGHGH